MTIKSTKTFIALAILLLAMATTTLAQVNYQGRLTDATGDPVTDASAFITFSLWDAAVDGNKLWGDQVIIADLIDGRFNLILGPNDNNNPQRSLEGVFSVTPGTKYLELKVGTDAPLPRQELLPTLTALHASRADDFNSTVLFKHEEPKAVDVRGTLNVEGDIAVEGDGELNVDGSINLGPLAALSAVAASSDVKIVYGSVTMSNGEPVVTHGQGFNVERHIGIAGRFNIGFVEPFAVPPVVIVTPHHTNDRPHSVSLYPLRYASAFYVLVWEGPTTWTRNWRGGFDFIAIGPR